MTIAPRWQDSRLSGRLHGELTKQALAPGAGCLWESPNMSDPGQGDTKATPRERGVALFAVLWVILIISILSVGVSRETRITARIAGNEMNSARAQAAADAGLEWMAFWLSERLQGGAPQGLRAEGWTSGTPLPVRFDGRQYAWSFGEAMVTLTLQAESGKLDLNRVQPEILVTALRQLVPAEANALSTEILVARRQRRQGQFIGWRLDERSFVRTSELASLPSMTPQLYARLSPLVTVWSGAESPDPLLAPDALFDALPLEPDERRLLNSKRRAGIDPVGGDPAAFILSARAVLPDGTVAGAKRLMEIDLGNPAQIRVIQKMSADLEAPARPVR